jgi:hypothetical protein
MNKNVTFSAEAALIQLARRRASEENTTLNELFRSWLAHYVSQPNAPEQYAELMKQLEYVEAGGHFSREEMNERR